MSSRTPRPRLLATLAILSSAAPALAAADYRASGGISRTVANSTSTIDSYDRNFPSAAGDRIHYDEDTNPEAPTIHALITSLADPSGLHALAEAQFVKNFPSPGETFNYSLTSSAFAQATFDDFVITGPAGSGPVTVSLNVHLDGYSINTSSDVPSGFSVASTNAQVVFFAKGENIGGGSVSASTRDAVVQPLQTTGSLTNFDGDDVITSPTFSAPVNTPFSIALQLSISAGIVVQYSNAVQASSTANFGNTLTFAADRPVFNNLPAGYSVNSVQANITNNALPEPATFALLAPAAFPLLRRRRRP